MEGCGGWIGLGWMLWVGDCSVDGFGCVVVFLFEWSGVVNGVLGGWWCWLDWDFVRWTDGWGCGVVLWGGLIVVDAVWFCGVR